MLSLVNAKHLDEYRLAVEFSDNKEGEVNLSELVHSKKLSVFNELQDINRFKSFTVDYTLIWNDELDVAPEYLYFKAFENDSDLQSLFQKWGYIS